LGELEEERGGFDLDIGNICLMNALSSST
jgi:hypothetical protein